MKIIRDIPYQTTTPTERGWGDLFLPKERPSGEPVLLIHGGGWNAMSKESLEPVALLLQAQGRPVFSVNYRLLMHSPWPACGDDCLEAARFMLNGGLIPHGLPSCERLLICGASAGGHLAMMTAVRLPSEKVERIISMAGPSRLDPRDDVPQSAIKAHKFLDGFFGVPTSANDQRVIDASPSLCIPENPPPLTCIHSKNDLLVPTSHSEEAVNAWIHKGGKAQVHWFDGPGELHGFWDRDDLATRQLIPDVQSLLIQSAQTA